MDIFLDNREALAGRSRSSGGCSSRWSGRSRPGTRGFSPSGSARRAATGGGCWRPRSPTPASCTACGYISDRPGVLAGIFQALGAERINVEDFELDHVSAERGGTLTMLVTGEEEAGGPRSCSSTRATASSPRR